MDATHPVRHSRESRDDDKGYLGPECRDKIRKEKEKIKINSS